MQVQLDQLLNYNNVNVISRYKKDYPHSIMPAEEALNELMKFIWLCHQHRSDKQSRPHDHELNFSCVIHAEMKDIDNMWHTFLLFTKDYRAFCDTYLNGAFFHHEPLIESKEVLDADKYALELARYLSYIYDHLGEHTLRKWFSQDPYSS